jgi:hypothetical protein
MLFLLSLLPLAVVVGVLAWAISALLRRGGDGVFELFAEAVFTWAGSVVGIWLGLAIVGSVLGLISSALIFTVILGAVHMFQPNAPWLLKLLLAGLTAAVVFFSILWRFLSLSFLRR